MHKRPSYPIRLLAKSLASLVAVAIAATCSFAGAPPAPGQVGLDYISHVRIGTSMCDTCPPRVCPGEPVVVTVSGVLPTGCVAFRGLRDLPVGAPFTVLAADFVVDTCGVACPASFTEFSASVTLPPAVSGFQRFTLISQVRTCPDTNVVASSRSHEFVYEVEPECLGTPPLDSLVRSFTSFRISPERRCDGDSLTLQLVKNGCPPCVHLQSLTYDPASGFEAVVNWTPLCAELRCVPETLSVALGRFAAGSHRLAADVHVRVLGTVVQDSVIAFTKFVAFDVPRDCGDPILDCLEPELPASGLPQRACGVTVARGGRGDVLVPIRTWVPAAGVQGYLDVSPRFRIVDMAYAGPAGGVHVSWAQDGMRTRFILFGGTAAVVPVGISNLLRVTVEHDSTYQDSTARFASWGTLNGRVEIASGPNGESIALCPSILLSLPPVIRLCIKSEPATCDANQDGHSDVRDLVLMTRCLWYELSPEDRARMCMDCDQDGVFAFQDLVCCARHILRLPLVPRDSVQANDALHVSFDEPQRDGDGWLVRVRLTGADALGAALLRLRYPAERWRADIPVFIGARTDAASEGWLPLIDPEQPGVVQLGGLRLAETASPELEFLLRLTPTAATHEADQLVVEGADLAALDGTVLTPAAALPNLSLFAPQSPPSLPASIELSPARPNPFARSTRFTVSLPREANVDLSVLDLAGRRVALLLKGRVAAGQRDVSWDGSNAREGVYFVKLVVDGRVYSRRVALLRNGR